MWRTRAFLRGLMDRATLLGYQLFYCSIHGHRRKFSMSHCVNCGKDMGW